MDYSDFWSRRPADLVGNTSDVRLRTKSQVDSSTHQEIEPKFSKGDVHNRDTTAAPQSWLTEELSASSDDDDFVEAAPASTAAKAIDAPQSWLTEESSASSDDDDDFVGVEPLKSHENVAPIVRSPSVAASNSSCSSKDDDDDDDVSTDADEDYADMFNNEAFQEVLFNLPESCEAPEQVEAQETSQDNPRNRNGYVTFSDKLHAAADGNNFFANENATEDNRLAEIYSYLDETCTNALSNRTDAADVASHSPIVTTTTQDDAAPTAMFDDAQSGVSLPTTELGEPTLDCASPPSSFETIPVGYYLVQKMAAPDLNEPVTFYWMEDLRAKELLASLIVPKSSNVDRPAASFENLPGGYYVVQKIAAPNSTEPVTFYKVEDWRAKELLTPSIVLPKPSETEIGMCKRGESRREKRHDPPTRFRPYPPTSSNIGEEGAIKTGGRVNARTVFNAEQLRVLQKEFESNMYISPVRRDLLALQLGLRSNVIQNWFTARRRNKSKNIKN